MPASFLISIGCHALPIVDNGQVRTTLCPDDMFALTGQNEPAHNVVKDLFVCQVMKIIDIV
jgi:hypothetical protein